MPTMRHWMMKAKQNVYFYWGKSITSKYVACALDIVKFCTDMQENIEEAFNYYAQSVAKNKTCMLFSFCLGQMHIFKSKVHRATLMLVTHLASSCRNILPCRALL